MFSLGVRRVDLDRPTWLFGVRALAGGVANEVDDGNDWAVKATERVSGTGVRGRRAGVVVPGRSAGGWRAVASGGA